MPFAPLRVFHPVSCEPTSRRTALKSILTCASSEDSFSCKGPDPGIDLPGFRIFKQLQECPVSSPRSSLASSEALQDVQEVQHRITALASSVSRQNMRRSSLSLSEYDDVQSIAQPWDNVPFSTDLGDSQLLCSKSPSGPAPEIPRRAGFSFFLNGKSHSTISAPHSSSAPVGNSRYLGENLPRDKLPALASSSLFKPMPFAQNKGVRSCDSNQERPEVASTSSPSTKPPPTSENLHAEEAILPALRNPLFSHTSGQVDFEKLVEATLQKVEGGSVSKDRIDWPPSSSTKSSLALPSLVPCTTATTATTTATEDNDGVFGDFQEEMPMDPLSRLSEQRLDSGVPARSSSMSKKPFLKKGSRNPVSALPKEGPKYHYYRKCTTNKDNQSDIDADLTAEAKASNVHMGTSTHTGPAAAIRSEDSGVSHLSQSQQRLNKASKFKNKASVCQPSLSTMNTLRSTQKSISKPSLNRCAETPNASPLSDPISSRSAMSQKGRLSVSRELQKCHPAQEQLFGNTHGRHQNRLRRRAPLQRGVANSSALDSPSISRSTACEAKETLDSPLPLPKELEALESAVLNMTFSSPFSKDPIAEKSVVHRTDSLERPIEASQKRTSAAALLDTLYPEKKQFANVAQTKRPAPRGSVFQAPRASTALLGGPGSSYAEIRQRELQFQAQKRPRQKTTDIADVATDTEKRFHKMHSSESNANESDQVVFPRELELLAIQAQAKVAAVDEQIERLKAYEQDLEEREAMLEREREEWTREKEQQQISFAAQREAQLLELEQERSSIHKGRRRLEATSDLKLQLETERDKLEEDNYKLRLSLVELQKEFASREARYRRLVERLGNQVHYLERKNKSLTQTLEGLERTSQQLARQLQQEHRQLERARLKHVQDEPARGLGTPSQKCQKGPSALRNGKQSGRQPVSISTQSTKGSTQRDFDVSRPQSSLAGDISSLNGPSDVSHRPRRTSRSYHSRAYSVDSNRSSRSALFSAASSRMLCSSSLTESQVKKSSCAEDADDDDIQTESQHCSSPRMTSARSGHSCVETSHSKPFTPHSRMSHHTQDTASLSSSRLQSEAPPPFRAIATPPLPPDCSALKEPDVYCHTNLEKNPLPLQCYAGLLDFCLETVWAPFDKALKTLSNPDALELKTPAIEKPDGRQEFYFKDSHREIVFGNGMRKVVCPDGWVFNFFPNGDLRGSAPSGHVYYYFSQDLIYHITYPDGKVFSSFSDGQVDCRHTSGTIQVRFPQGLLKQIDPDGTEHIQRDATKTSS